MLRTLKVNEVEDKILFISDLHHGHDKDFIHNPRGFKNLQEHDETIIKRWNEACSESSIVFHLGDICFNDPTSLSFKNLIRRLKFKTLYCLWGNHNASSKAAYLEEIKIQFQNLISEDGREFYEVYPLWHDVDGNPEKKVCFLPEYVEARINGHHIILSHYPIYSHHKQGHGSIALSGHCHGNCKLTNKNTGIGKRLDVGVESFGRPISFREVLSLMRGREIDMTDHHSKETT